VKETVSTKECDSGSATRSEFGSAFGSLKEFVTRWTWQLRWAFLIRKQNLTHLKCRSSRESQWRWHCQRLKGYPMYYASGTDSPFAFLKQCASPKETYFGIESAFSRQLWSHLQSEIVIACGSAFGSASVFDSATRYARVMPIAFDLTCQTDSARRSPSVTRSEFARCWPFPILTLTRSVSGNRFGFVKARPSRSATRSQLRVPVCDEDPDMLAEPLALGVAVADGVLLCERLCVPFGSHCGVRVPVMLAVWLCVLLRVWLCDGVPVPLGL